MRFLTFVLDLWQLQKLDQYPRQKETKNESTEDRELSYHFYIL